MRAVIIAGGSGTRLRPLTYNLPKPVIPLFNKPFLVYQIELLKAHGITDIIINTHYLHSQLKEILDARHDLGVNLYYSFEHSPMGTAGAVKLAESYFDDDPLLVLNGDVLTDINLTALIEQHRQKNAEVTISLTKVKDPTAYGLIFADQDLRVTRFLEKPSYDEATVNTINAGVYLINPDLFKFVPQNEPYSFERGLFPLILNLEKNFYSYVSDDYWLDIGTPEKYMQAHHDALLERIKLNIPGKKNDKNIWFGTDTDIHDSVKLQGPVFIGDKTKIRKGCFIEEFCVIGNNALIDDRTQIYKSLVLTGSKIGENCAINECIIGSNCVIEDDCRITKNSVIADHTVLGRGSII
jgi:mannose-1-phosphate guanylyltransferase/phosphomannomutase